MLPKYIVKPGDTMQKIAKQYGVSVDELVNTNLMIKEQQRMPAGTVVYLPSTFDYVARTGETLDSIARKFGFSLQQLYLFNQWLPQTGPIGVGEHVWIPRSKFTIHIVRQGETLAVIANRVRIPLAELVAMNAPLLPNPSLTIRPGAHLAIPSV